MTPSLARVTFLALLFGLTAALAQGQSPGPRLSRDLRFEANAGQTAPEVAFVTRGRGQTIYLTPTATVFSSPLDVVRMRLLGADPTAKLSGRDRLPGATNYLVGDRRDWVRGVVSYGQIIREQVYPGIDMVYRGDDGALAYDFVIAPGAKPSRIRLRFEGMARLAITRSGDLAVTTAAGVVTHRRPVAFQDCGGSRRAVPARFRLGRGQTVTFQVGNYDARCPLTIDPTVVRASYFGGNDPGRPAQDGGGGDGFTAITLDDDGNQYLTGSTNSVPSTLPGAAPVGGGTLLVTKIDPAGDVVYNTLIGAPASTGFGSGGEAIAIDVTGAVYVTGLANEPFFPVTPGTVSSSGPGFVLKLDPSGSSLVYSVLVPVVPVGIAVDANRHAIIAGSTYFDVVPPLVNALQPVRGSSTDGYLAKLNADASAFVFATYLGGNTGDALFAVKTDPGGHIYVAGDTHSPDFPVRNAFQSTLASFGFDCIVAKLPADGSELIYSTFLGGTGTDQCLGIAVDAAGKVVVTGQTQSDDFPLRRAFQSSRSPGEHADAFLSHFEADAQSLRYSTYLGGTLLEFGLDVALGADGDAYVIGWTGSSDFPTVRPTQSFHAGPLGAPLVSFGDTFVARFDPIGRPVYSTFFGGSDVDEGMGIAADGLGRAHVVGATRSPDLPLVNPLDSEFEGFSEGFLLTIADAPCPADITGGVVVVPIPAFTIGSGFSLQFLLLVNVTASPVATPVSVTFDGLTPGIFLVSPGFTFCPATNGAQFAALGTPGLSVAPGSAILSAVLCYSSEPALQLSYSTRVLSGRPHR